MKFLVTEQQKAFFSQNGYIELEGIPFDSQELFSSARSSLLARANLHSKDSFLKSLNRIPPAQAYLLGRDLWRDDKKLKTLLLRRIAFTALELMAKPIRIGCDQWIPSGMTWATACPFKDLFSLQGFALGAFFCCEKVALPERAHLGLLPLPKDPQTILFVKPTLLLDWPSLIKSPATDLYFAAYAFQTAVYVQNPKDPSTNFLKQLGYHFGDVLNNDSHPSLFLGRGFQ